MKLNFLRGIVAVMSGIIMLVSCDKKEEIPDPVALPTPSGFSFTATSSNLTFSWTSIEGAAKYVYELKDENDAIISKTISEPTASFDGLDSESNFSIRVKATPETDSKQYLESEWSEWFSALTTEGEIAKKFHAGAGTEEDPYIITSVPQLAYLAKLVNEEAEGYCENGVYYELGADLDLADYENWEPIGVGYGSDCLGTADIQGVKSFNGSFNGAGHTIKNLNISATRSDEEAYVGLFGVNLGRIEMLNVEGNVKASSNFTEGGTLCVGGIVGISGIGYDAEGAIIMNTGMIISCSFKGSVEGNSNADVTGRAIVGGICGYANSGNIDNCTLDLAKDESIKSISGYSPAVGGLVGYYSAGRMSVATANIAGTISAEFVNDSDEAENYDQSAAAGGVIGACGRLQNDNGGAGLTNCGVNVSGLIYAKGSGLECSACVGGVVAYSNADITSACKVEVSGTLHAESNCGSYVGGICGSPILSYGGANNFTGCEVKVTSTGVLKGDQAFDVVDTNLASVSVGGIIGAIGGGATATVISCSAEIDGSLIANNASTEGQFTNCGGIIGSAAGVRGCNAKFGSTAKVSMSGYTTMFGGIAGIYKGSNNITFYGNYAIVNGTVETSFASDYIARVGGVAGFANGGRVGMKFQNAAIRACYGVLDADIKIAGTTEETSVGAVCASAMRYVFSNNWWSSKNSTIFGFAGDDADNATSGISKFDSFDEAGTATGAADMNQYFTDNELPVQYAWSSESSCLILK